MSQHRGPVIQHHLARRPPDLQADNRSRSQQLSPEMLSLQPRPLGQLVAGHPIGEAEVVVDPRALTRLSASCRPLDDDGLETLRRCVDCGAKAGRAHRR